MQKFLGVVREAWDSTSSCRGLRLTQSDYTANTFGRRTSVLVRFVFAPLLDHPSHHLIPSYCPNSRVILECESPLEVCCSCHAASASTFPLSLHDWPALSHAGASGLEKKSDTFSGLMHTLLHGLLIMKSADDDWEELRLNTFCDASFGTRCFGRHKVKLTGLRSSPFLIEWANRLQGPESESIECGRAAKATLRVKGALDACRSSQFLVMVTWTTMRSAWQ